VQEKGRERELHAHETFISDEHENDGAPTDSSVTGPLLWWHCSLCIVQGSVIAAHPIEQCRCCNASTVRQRGISENKPDYQEPKSPYTVAQRSRPQGSTAVYRERMDALGLRSRHTWIEILQV
jgi:hypothetical protein